MKKKNARKQTKGKGYDGYLKDTLMVTIKNFLFDNPDSANEVNSVVCRCLKLKSFKDDEDRGDIVEMITARLPVLSRDKSNAHSFITEIWDGLDFYEEKIKKNSLKAISDLGLPIKSISIELNKKTVLSGFTDKIFNFITDSAK